MSTRCNRHSLELNRGVMRELFAQPFLGSKGIEPTMWTALKAVVLAVASYGIVVGTVCAEPDKVQYELQERCGKRSEEAFQALHAGLTCCTAIRDTDDGQSIETFQNHYSAALNKCFYLEVLTSQNYKKLPRYTSTLMTLYDLHEHKEYASFYKRSDSHLPTECRVGDKVCRSESEWNDLLKPYMEH